MLFDKQLKAPKPEYGIWTIRRGNKNNNKSPNAPRQILDEQVNRNEVSEKWTKTGTKK